MQPPEHSGSKHSASPKTPGVDRCGYFVRFFGSLGTLGLLLLVGALGHPYFLPSSPTPASIFGKFNCGQFRNLSPVRKFNDLPSRQLQGKSWVQSHHVIRQVGQDRIPDLLDGPKPESKFNSVKQFLTTQTYLGLDRTTDRWPKVSTVEAGHRQVLLPGFVLKLCNRPDQSTQEFSVTDSIQNLNSAGQLARMDLQQFRLPATVNSETNEVHSAGDQSGAQDFLGIVIEEGGANVREGPALEQPVIYVLAFGRQFIFEGGDEDEEWLELEPGNWISASNILVQPIFQDFGNVSENKPTGPEPTLTEARLLAEQSDSGPQWQRLTVGTVIAEDGAQVRVGPGLEFRAVSAVPYGHLVGWVAFSKDGEWLYLQHGLWISAPLVLDQKTFSLVSAVVKDESAEIDSPMQEPVAEFTPTVIEKGQSAVLLATVIAEAGAELRSGPGIEYAIVDTVSFSEQFSYVARSQNQEWLLLSNGDWILASRVSTRKSFDGPLPSNETEPELPDPEGESPPFDRSEARVPGPLTGETLELTEEMKALRFQTVNYINQARVQEGLSPLAVGNNQAAQNQAAEQAEFQFVSDWNIAGLGPKIRYVQAGGASYNAHVGAYHGKFASTECFPGVPFVQKLELMLDRLMETSYHRVNILGPDFTTMHIGIAEKCSNMSLQIILEGEYVSYETPPHIKEGQISMQGRLHNGASLSPPGTAEGIKIVFRTLPQPLTRGQLFRAGGYCNGKPIASIPVPFPFQSIFERFPREEWVSASFSWVLAEARDSSEELSWWWDQGSCSFPFDLSPESLPPENYHEAKRMMESAGNREEDRVITFGKAVQPEVWRTTKDTFTIQADLSELLAEHGPGVYIINLWGKVNGNQIYLSEYPIIVE